MTLLLFWAGELLSASGIILHNQVGYYPKAIKRALATDPGQGKFEIHNQFGEIVFRGALDPQGHWDLAGQSAWLADFSAVSELGQYQIVIPDVDTSAVFRIHTHVLNDALRSGMKSFYYQRLSTDLPPQYAGHWSHAGGLPDQKCYYHPSSGRLEGFRPSPGGWFDAGDYNKYIVNGGVTVSTLLATHELMPFLFPDGSLNIPESGNGINDLLDEVRWELDWVLTMQDDDGGVFHKLTSKNFCGFIMPEDDDSERWVVGKSTADALNFAAMLAQARRVYATVDPPFSKKCLAAAERAWKWALENDQVYYSNPEDVVTGAYGDVDMKEEFVWAAAELYASTGSDRYLQEFTDRYEPVTMVYSESWRTFVDKLGVMTLLLSRDNNIGELQAKLAGDWLAMADAEISRMEQSPFRVSVNEFHWGSNSDVLNSALITAIAHLITGDDRYLNATIEITDYIFGKNASTYSQLTGFGSRSPMNIHHRPSAADGIPEPVPGFVVGGPNADGEDDIEKFTWGIPYTYTEPARRYEDVLGSYATNEICLNWNAPFVFVIGYLESGNWAQSVH